MSRWAAVIDVTSSCRNWDNEYVVYHPESGDVHLLNEVSFTALQILTEEPETPANLAARTAERLGYLSDAAFEKGIAHMLEQFRCAQLADQLCARA